MSRTLLLLLVLGTLGVAVFAQTADHGLTAGITMNGKCVPAGAVCPKSPPTPEWVPDPSAGHYDCPDGWTAFRPDEPTKFGNNGIAIGIYHPLTLDRKGHLLYDRPPVPICIQDAP